MTNPSIPVRASFPVPPPLANLPFGTIGPGGMVYPATTFMEFIQILWASIQGQDGILDILLSLQPSPGQVSAAVESLLAQQVGPAASEGALHGAIAAVAQRTAEAYMLAVQPSPRRPSEPIVRFYGDLPGQPTAGQELFAITMVGDEHFTKGLGRNVGGVLVPPTGAVTFPIKVNGVQIGTMNVAMGATTATWTMANPYNALAGDIFAFYAPPSVDATLSGPHYTFVGTRS